MMAVFTVQSVARRELRVLEMFVSLLSFQFGERIVTASETTAEGTEAVVLVVPKNELLGQLKLPSMYNGPRLAKGQTIGRQWWLHW